MKEIGGILMGGWDERTTKGRRVVVVAYYGGRIYYSLSKSSMELKGTTVIGI